MNGSGTQPQEAAVPPTFSDEQDPLLEFSNESAESAAVPVPDELTTQPVAAPTDPPRQSPPSVSSDALIARVDRLEQALNESKTQVATLTSEVATLVRAIGDIRKQSTRPQSPSTIPFVRRYGRPSWAASAIVATIMGFVAAIFGWTYLAGDGDTSSTASAATPPVVADSPSANTAPTANEPRPPASIALAALAAPAARVTEAPAPKAPRAAQTPKYVGTLSIDADPGGEVFLNRQRVGHTPLRLANLRAGSHLIWIEREGYRRWTRVVSVRADNVSRLSADLEPIVTR